MPSQSSQPLVSVIIPMYNASSFIKETLQSVFQQTFQNFEVIVVDDQSTDNSYQLVSEMLSAYSNLSLLKNVQNSGVAISRNKGVSYAKGRFICFLDADDLWLPNKLEVQVAFMLKYGYAFSFTSYQFADETGKPIKAPITVPEKISYQQALRDHTIWTSTVMLDLEQLSKEEIAMPDVRRGQDTATWWKILKVVKYAYSINQPLSIYRRTNQSLSANKFAAIKRTWYLFRKVEGLSVIETVGPFIGYAYNAVKRRM